ncbi:MAG TPA: LysR substrate-binding domain-containing protein [Alphaproteobacteria bacterium]|nr:LysR substrate-binding domain-containing protein [Alphaproteobacteria bacterium]
MQLRDLEYLVAVADHGHFGRAAEACHVSQPTLSAQVAKLEDELGVQVFERGRRIAVTPSGRAVVEQARAVLDSVQQLRAVARAALQPLAGPFYLGVIASAGPYLLPRLLPLLARLHPELRLYLREDITERLIERLKQGRIDAAILSLPIDDPALRLAPLLEEDFVLALPPGHPLAGRATVGLEEIAGENLLVLEEGHCFRAQALQLCAGAGARPATDFAATSIESLRQMVAAGIGGAVIPGLAAEGAFAQAAPVALVPFERPAPSRSLVVAWRRTFPRGDAIRQMAEGLRAALG